MTRKNISEAIGSVSNRHIEEVMSCLGNMEETKMPNSENRKRRWSGTAAAAAVAACVGISGISALAASDTLQGFFKDIFHGGAVIGTAYEQASDEIELNITEVSRGLTVELIMSYPEKVPYSELEALDIGSYRIVGADGSIIAEGSTTSAELRNGCAAVRIPLDNVSGGDYSLIVSEMTGFRKADQPLSISGIWECDFTL